MGQAILAQIKNEAVPILKEAGVIRSSLFGSCALGQEKKGSDIDILIELPRGKTLFDLVDLKAALEKKLGKKVDLVTFRSIHPHLRESILSNQVPIL